VPILQRIFEFLCNQPFDTFMRGKLVYTSRIPAELRLLILLAALAIVWFAYRKAAARTPAKVYRIILGLRVALVVLLVVLLGAPVLRVSTPRKENLFTAVLVDTSQSMSITDVDTSAGQVSRIHAAQNLLFAGDGKGLVGNIAEDSQVVLYSFSGSAQRASEKNLTDATGASTNIYRAIHDVKSELGAVTLAAVVLVTDGGRNSGGTTEDAARLLEARGVPLYAIGVGNPNPPKDYEVVEVAAPHDVRRNTEVSLDVTVRYTGFDKPFPLLLKHGDDVLVRQIVSPLPDTDLRRVRMEFTPDQDGVATYRVEIPPVPEEKITENNHRDFVMEIKDDRLPVLYIEGSPRTEYRFLRRAMFRDTQFRVVGVLRLASGRFYLQGINDSEAYLKDGFPDTAERLDAFQAVILGDVEAGLFTPKQQELLEQFVKQRGGGLLMLGGVNSFGLGGWAGTPVGKMLPVSIAVSDPHYSDEEYPVELVPENLGHPVMRMAQDPVENAELWHNMPPLIGVTPVGQIKAGASLLLDKPITHDPVLAVQNYGQGRVAAFTSGGSWYWQVSRPANDGFYERFWKQMLRWLVVGAKEQLTANTDAEIYVLHDPVSIRATVLGKDMQPLDDAAVTATVTDPLGNVHPVAMDWILSEEGVYQCQFMPSAEGQYKVSVAVKGWDSPPLVRGFLVSQGRDEFANASLKREPLMAMAAITHGKYFDLAQGQSIAQEIRKGIQTSAVATADSQDYPIWNMPLAFMFIVLLASAEWWIRRRNGLS